MTEERLKEIEERNDASDGSWQVDACKDCLELVAEVRRLRGVCCMRPKTYEANPESPNGCPHDVDLHQD